MLRNGLLLQGGWKAASRGLHLEGGFKGASRGLQAGFTSKGASRRQVPGGFTLEVGACVKNMYRGNPFRSTLNTSYGRGCE